MSSKKQTPMYWQNGMYGCKTDHQIDRDLDAWVKEQYIKHHSQKSGAFSIGEITEGKGESSEHHSQA